MLQEYLPIKLLHWFLQSRTDIDYVFMDELTLCGYDVEVSALESCHSYLKGKGMWLALNPQYMNYSTTHLVYKLKTSKLFTLPQLNRNMRNQARIAEYGNNLLISMINKSNNTTDATDFLYSLKTEVPKFIIRGKEPEKIEIKYLETRIEEGVMVLLPKPFDFDDKNVEQKMHGYLPMIQKVIQEIYDISKKQNLEIYFHCYCHCDEHLHFPPFHPTI